MKGAKQLVSLVGLAGLVPPACADVATQQQTLIMNLSAAAKFISIPATTSMSESAGPFSSFIASLPVNFRIRTSSAGSTSQMSLQVTTDFSPANGPSAAAGDLTYTCSGSTLGTVCSGQPTASTTSQTKLISFAASSCTGGGGVCSSADPNTFTMSFQLNNSPQFKASNYAAILTFTLSAL